MKSKKQLLDDILELAKQNVSIPELLEFSIDIGKRLSNFYNADSDLVLIGTCFEDIKLREALAMGRLKEHILMAVEFAKEFLKDYDLTEEEIKIIINCIEAHHGTISYKYIEAEVCANADCYNFIHPKGVFIYMSLLVRRGMTIEQLIQQLKNKLDEKYKILSLTYAKSELEEYYNMFSKLFDDKLYK